MRAIAAQARNVPQRFRPLLGVGNLHALALAERRRGREIDDRTRRKRPKRGVGFGADRGERGEMGGLALEAPDHRRIAAEQPICAVRDGVEHRLGVGRRGGDDLQDFRGRSLALERPLRLVEQPCVLDRDRRLVGEALGERDFLVREGFLRLARDDDRADAAILEQHRRIEHGQTACGPHRRPVMLGEVGPVGEVGKMNRAALGDRKSGRASGERLIVAPPVAAGPAALRRSLHPVAVDEIDSDHLEAKQPPAGIRGWP